MDTGLEWIGEGVFHVGDLLFKDGGPHGLKTTSEEVIIRKSRQHLQGDDPQVRVSVLARGPRGKPMVARYAGLTARENGSTNLLGG